MFKVVVSIYVTSDFKECLKLKICHKGNEKKKNLMKFQHQAGIHLLTLKDNTLSKQAIQHLHITGVKVSILAIVTVLVSMVTINQEIEEEQHMTSPFMEIHQMPVQPPLDQEMIMVLFSLLQGKQENHIGYIIKDLSPDTMTIVTGPLMDHKKTMIKVSPRVITDINLITSHL